MSTVAILQARSGGTRLPGKVLADVGGQPMIARQMHRLEMASLLDDIVVAIPDSATDDALAEECLRRGWALYRGPENDVLGRYLGAAEAIDAETVVRATADCPFIDPFVIDDAIRLFRTGTKAGRFDFVANNLVPTFPHGLDCEVMSRATLAIAAAKAEDPYDREHVSPWITRATAGGAIFRLGNLAAPADLSHFRLTVDYPEDLQVCRAIYARFQSLAWFSTRDVLDFLSLRPDLVALNACHRRAPMRAMGIA